jgi:hypothetical protein
MSGESVTLAVPTVIGEDVVLEWTVNIGDGANPFTSFAVYRNGFLVFGTTNINVLSFTDSTGQANTAFTYQVIATFTEVQAFSNFETVTTGDAIVFNCDCEIASPFRTLAQVRTAMLVRLGYPNQSITPPPGMTALIDQHLFDAQRQIYRTITRAGKRTERFFNWTMVPGQRYYNFADSDSGCDGLQLDPNKLSWVGFEDLNQAWYRLDEGIPPEYYTRANINFGWPTRYEIRSCIEIFPAPQAPYTLWLKGDFGLAPLAADGDRFTIDDQACFLLALGTMKTERGARDAQLVLKAASDYVMGLVAGTHGTARYVPNSATLNPLTPPKFLPLGNGPA